MCHSLRPTPRRPQRVAVGIVPMTARMIVLAALACFVGFATATSSTLTIHTMPHTHCDTGYVPPPLSLQPEDHHSGPFGANRSHSHTPIARHPPLRYKKTFEGYFITEVRPILFSLVQALGPSASNEQPPRRFIWSGMLLGDPSEHLYITTVANHRRKPPSLTTVLRDGVSQKVVRRSD